MDKSAVTGATTNTATWIGFAAVLMWALLAILTAASGAVPPFQLNALSFAVGTAVGFLWMAMTGRWRDLVQPLRVWALGVVGLFGYHALYFTALRNAPPIEAGLIAYLWPLLIVIFSAALPGERLRWFHIAGGLLGFLGAALIVTRGASLSFEARHGAGYLAAVACALTWSSYSVLSRRNATVPTGAVVGFCAAAALLSVPFHLALETTVWPRGGGEWAAVLGLGLMPVGAAFYVWDIGVKRGNIQLLGVLSYAAPLLSTVILILFGYGVFTWQVAAAALLITLGALTASRALRIPTRSGKEASAGR
ncbi:DMT family transporter [Fodinicurvata sp. EGI_FJ10296]|uniref:aromatic amino acid exporter YddG n=1 Tax=Fodinicurvata sp. EGI_FJ10296 TaxID=3231908 RepID=UPI0034519DDA